MCVLQIMDSAFVNLSLCRILWSHVAGTFAYAAPELLLNEPCDSSADLYSFGVLLWEIVTRRNPARGRLLPPQVPEECPAEIVDLIQVPVAS